MASLQPGVTPLVWAVHSRCVAVLFDTQRSRGGRWCSQATRHFATKTNDALAEFDCGEHLCGVGKVALVGCTPKQPSSWYRLHCKSLRKAVACS
eukprot:2544070-Rhodomonas_salina.1